MESLSRIFNGSYFLLQNAYSWVASCLLRHFMSIKCDLHVAEESQESRWCTLVPVFGNLEAVSGLIMERCTLANVMNLVRWGSPAPRPFASPTYSTGSRGHSHRNPPLRWFAKAGPYVSQMRASWNNWTYTMKWAARMMSPITPCTSAGFIAAMSREVWHVAVPQNWSRCGLKMNSPFNPKPLLVERSRLNVGNAG